MKKIHLYFTACILFLLPIIFIPSITHAFTIGKEIPLKILLSLEGLIISIFFKQKLNFRKIWKFKLTKILAALGALIILSTIFSDYPNRGIMGSPIRGMGLITYGFLTIFFLLNANFLKRKNLHKILTASFLAATIVAIYAIFQKFGLEIFFKNFNTSIFANRSYSFLGNPSFLGQFLTLEFLIGIYLLTFYKNKKTLTALALAEITIFSGLITSESRTAIVALIVGLTILLIKYSKKIFSKENWKKSLTITTFSLVIITTILINLTPKINQSRFQNNQIAHRSIKSRIEIWQSAIRLIKEKPTGYGQETFQIYFPDQVDANFYLLEENHKTIADRTHNGFLEITFSAGIIAGLIYLILIIHLLTNLIKSKNTDQIFLLTIILTNITQNQLSFPDITILTLQTFCLSALIAITIPKQLKNPTIKQSSPYRTITPKSDLQV